MKQECSSCRSALTLPDHLIGQKVRCPKCKDVFVATPPATIAPLLEAPPIDPAENFASVFSQDAPDADHDDGGDPFLRDAPRPQRRRRQDDDETPLTDLQGGGIGILAIALTSVHLAMEILIAVALDNPDRVNQMRPGVMGQLLVFYLIIFACAKIFLANWIAAAHANLALFRVVGVTTLPRLRLVQSRVGVWLANEGQLIREIWKGSDPELEGPGAGTAWKKGPLSPLVIAYLFLRVLRLFCAPLAFAMATDPRTPARIWGLFLVPSFASTICLTAFIILVQIRQKKKLASQMLREIGSEPNAT